MQQQGTAAITVYDRDRALAELAAALLAPSGLVGGRLSIHRTLRPGTVAALVELMTDVQVIEWVGESGSEYRSHRGVLPSGLPLDVVTML